MYRTPVHIGDQQLRPLHGRGYLHLKVHPFSGWIGEGSQTRMSTVKGVCSRAFLPWKYRFAPQQGFVPVVAAKVSVQPILGLQAGQPLIGFGQGFQRL